MHHARSVPNLPMRPCSRLPADTANRRHNFTHQPGDVALHRTHSQPQWRWACWPAGWLAHTRHASATM
jgi:hypothetical protein